MSVSLKNKISQYETVPPAGVWDKLSLQLDQEFSVGDSLLSTRLENTFSEPPVSAWDNIAAALGHEEIRTRARVIPLIYKRLAVAALLLGAISMVTIYLVNRNSADQDAAIVRNTPAATVETDPAPPVSADRIASSPKTLIASLKAANKASRASSRKPLANYISNKLFNEPEMDIADPKPIAKLTAFEPVQVAAPPIRDAGGNIIMDYAVITNPGEPYITVTSPNGNQTKISQKFLGCIKYLNSNFSSSGINYEEQQWKSRFQEWRNKINSATIVPAASNFFDIFELQELIRD